MMRAFTMVLIFAGLTACGQGQQHADTAAQTSSWLYGGGNAHQNYSALDEIDKANVHLLEPLWTYDTQGNAEAGTMHSTPLLAGGTLFVAGPEAGIHALDPLTGKRKWVFRFPYPEKNHTWFKGAPRGLMYWSEGDETRIFSMAGRYVFSVNAETGELDTAFGQGGAINLSEGLGRDPDTVDAELGSPGVIYRDIMILGSRMGEQLPTAPGHIRGYNVRTGEMIWIFHTIPQPGEAGHETWPEDAWQYTGGVNNWAGMALDDKRGIVYLGTGSAASDFYGADRQGDNLYANSILAMDAMTGELKWHRQIVRHDLWDRDIPAPPTLAIIDHDGKSVDALIQITKSGHIWVLDRDTGEALFPVEEVSVPAAGLPGETPAASQQVPILPEPFARQTLTDADLTTRTEQAHAAAKAVFDSLPPHAHFQPPSERGQFLFPGFDGGGEWGGGAFDPETGLFYVNANEMAWVLKMVRNEDRSDIRYASQIYATMCAACHGAERTGTGEFPSLIGVSDKFEAADVHAIIASGYGRMPGFSAALDDDTITAVTEFVLTGTDMPVVQGSIRHSGADTSWRLDGYVKFLDPDGYPAISPPWGTLTAVDMATGRHAWRVPLGEYPELVREGVTDTGSENYGGPVVTAGGLLFIGATQYDRKIRAFDKATGELLWSHELPASAVGTPAIYETDGRQILVTAAGGPRNGGNRGASYVAFALPDNN